VDPSRSLTGLKLHPAMEHSARTAAEVSGILLSRIESPQLTIVPSSKRSDISDTDKSRFLEHYEGGGMFRGVM